MCQQAMLTAYILWFKSAVLVDFLARWSNWIILFSNARLEFLMSCCGQL